MSLKPLPQWLAWQSLPLAKPVEPPDAVAPAAEFPASAVPVMTVPFIRL